MAFNAGEFRAQMQGDGARPNLFEVQMVFPTFVNPGAANRKLSFMCKTASLPGSVQGVVPVYYFGRESKLKGNKTYPEWTLSILNDEDFAIRNAFEMWMNGMNRAVTNVSDKWAGNALGYSTQALVNQYSKTGEILKTYVFEGIFPVDVSQIDVDWGSNDTIEEFSVTMAYQYWTSTSKNNTVIV
jgi:hypothetical protein